MRLLDRYVSTELFVPLLLGGVTILMMLVGNTLYATLEDALRIGWPLAFVVRLLIIALLFLLGTTAASQTPSSDSIPYSRRVWRSMDGLPEDFVESYRLHKTFRLAASADPNAGRSAVPPAQHAM